MDYSSHAKKAFCKATLDSQNGSTAERSDVLVDSNGHIPDPTELTRFGYTFGGWYKDAYCNNVFDFANDVVTDDITLYAKWTSDSSVLAAPVLIADTSNNAAGQVAVSGVLIDDFTLTATGTVKGTIFALYPCWANG
ncbi:MAG: InlB B-repeat-containing protein [Syntrophomonas sp.]|nr:InlB B-repeat-containing protein [Syntrophomonas sp.]MDD3880229.1 InlB B-repeat-containing protein [Syntrophomonas sp.]